MFLSLSDGGIPGLQPSQSVPGAGVYCLLRFRLDDGGLLPLLWIWVRILYDFLYL